MTNDFPHNNLPSRYARAGELGGGLMGVVVEAVDSDTGQPVVAKHLLHVRPADPAQFRGAVEALGRLDHPHLAKSLGWDDGDSGTWLISEYVAGSTLLDYLRQPATADERRALDTRAEQLDRRLDEAEDVPPSGSIEVDPGPGEPSSPQDSGPEVTDEQPSTRSDRDSAAAIDEPAAGAEASSSRDRLNLVLLRLGRVLPQLIDALEHLHRFRTPHGDLKPANIRVDPNGRCVLTDYGILSEVELVGQPADDDPLQPPSEKARACAYRYRAPDALDFQESSAQADLYALGCILFEAISGHPPFEGALEDIRRQQLDAQPPSLSELQPYCPASWVDLIHGLLDKDPAQRRRLADLRQLVEYSETYAVEIPPSAVPEQEFFFGRSDLIDTIAAELKQCYQQKRLSLSMLQGPAGVGKTAISQAISYLAARRGWLVLDGACAPGEGLIYQGWDEPAAQLASLFDDLPDDLTARADACRRQSASLFPVLGHHDDRPPVDRDRLDTVDAFRMLLRSLSTQRPLLIRLDDLQWASPDTAGLLLDLLGEPRGCRCLVLGTWLDGTDHANASLRQWLDTAPAEVTWHDIRGLTKDEAREYVISAGSDLPLDVQRGVLRQGNFNPLMLGELIRRSRPADHRDPFGADDHDARPTLSEDRRAMTPRDILAKMLDDHLSELSTRQRFVLDVLSVAAIPLPAVLVSAVLDEEFHAGSAVAGAADEVLNDLLDIRLIEPLSSHRWPVAYGVVHNSYRQLLVDQLRDQRYEHLNRRLADGIQRCWPAAEELRFTYLVRADQQREAADAAVQAASQAEQRLAYNRAAQLWEWLADHAGRTSLSPEIAPNAERARLEYLAGHFGPAADLYRQLANDVAPGLHQAQLFSAASTAAVHAAQYAQAEAALEGALDALGDTTPADGFVGRLIAVKNRALIATSRWTHPVADAAVGAADDAQQLRGELYKRGLDISDMLDPRQVGRLQTGLSMLARHTDDAWLCGIDRLYQGRDASLYDGRQKLRRATRCLREASALFDRVGDREVLGLTAIFSADQLRLAGEFDAATDKLATATRYFQSCGPHHFDQRYLLKLSYAELLLARGRLADAESLCRQILHFWRGDRHVSFRTYQVLIPCYMLCGDTDFVDDLLERCRQIIDPSSTSLAGVWIERMQALLNIAWGRPEVAVGQLDVLAERMYAGGLDGDQRAGVMLQLSLGQALAGRANREMALIEHRNVDTLGRLKDAVGRLERDAGTAPRVTRAEIGRLISRYELLRGHPRKALRVLDRVVDQLTDYDNPIEHAKCLEARGVILRSQRNSDGPDLIDLAHNVYSHFGAHLPLFVEGWPVPSQFSRLREDQA